MPRTDRFAERIGAVVLPECDTIGPADPGPAALKRGCYRLSFVPSGSLSVATRYRGTLRVEHTSTGMRISGDLYRHSGGGEGAYEDAATIPIHARTAYHSYLKGTAAQETSRVALEFDEFVYAHPAEGFSGSFDETPTRSLRCVLARTETPDSYEGEAFAGATKVGAVSMRWVSSFYRRAQLRIHTLEGADRPPDVGETTFATIWADVGWELDVIDEGAFRLPPALSSVDINACWKRPDLQTLLASLPGYDPADLDSVWRVHLIAVPATLGCTRGVMFDPAGFSNGVPREASATYSHDGYPADESQHFDAATGQQQRNVPRAYLRSAAHEVGHAFNLIHQEQEGIADNSIMATTAGVAGVIGSDGTFPDDIDLTFNERFKRHLNHRPDPVVRPGAMSWFGSASQTPPEAADVAWIETAELALELSSDGIRLGEPVELRYWMTNAGDVPLAVPASLDTESLTVRVNVTDPLGRITFVRPPRVHACPRHQTTELAPGASMSGSTTVSEGFAFEMPGRHVVEVIALWHADGLPVGAAAEREVVVAAEP